MCRACIEAELWAAYQAEMDGRAAAKSLDEPARREAAGGGEPGEVRAGPPRGSASEAREPIRT
jgi:hypothetical protein